MKFGSFPLLSLDPPWRSNFIWIARSGLASARAFVASCFGTARTDDDSRNGYRVIELERRSVEPLLGTRSVPRAGSNGYPRRRARARGASVLRS